MPLLQSAKFVWYRSTSWKISCMVLMLYVIFLYEDKPGQNFDIEKPLWKQVPWMEMERLDSLIALETAQGGNVTVCSAINIDSEHSNQAAGPL